MTNEPSRPKNLIWLTGLYLPAFAICWALWLWARILPTTAAAVAFGLALPLGMAWLLWCWRSWRTRPVHVGLALTLVYIIWWQFFIFLTDAIYWDAVCKSIYQCGLGVLFIIGLSWVVWGLEKVSRRFEQARLNDPATPVEDRALKPLVDDQATVRRIWNPLDSYAWYYGRRGRKLNQSLTALMAYTCLFYLIVLLLSQTRGCEDISELPAGGGKQKQIAQTVKIQKVIRKKFVVNPFSGISFEVPPIDNVKLQLQEVTKHAYTVGYGEGAGAGYAGGTGRGKVELIRLEYGGGDWDLNFGIGADLNMLVEYGVRTGQKVAERTESRTINDLKRYPKEKAPPYVFMTGQKSISLTNGEIKVLQEYLAEKHGMIFASNGGSGHWHTQFLAMMNQVAPGVRPVAVPLDDPIHAIPYQIPFLPYVAPHGGKEALGWYKDGRWICYYHPGDISDAWCDDHAGVRAEVWEACFQLGTNVIQYACAQKSKWLESQKKPGN